MRKNTLLDLDELDRYLVEGTCLIKLAEDCQQSLKGAGACEGHQLMAAQLLRAMNRLQTGIRYRREQIALQSMGVPTTKVSVRRRPWWRSLMPGRRDLGPQGDFESAGLN